MEEDKIEVKLRDGVTLRVNQKWYRRFMLKLWVLEQIIDVVSPALYKSNEFADLLGTMNFEDICEAL